MREVSWGKFIWDLSGYRPCRRSGYRAMLHQNPVKGEQNSHGVRLMTAVRRVTEHAPIFTARLWFVRGVKP